MKNSVDAEMRYIMKLTFLGADHEVTGSCHFLQAAGLNILVDCGMEQGNDVYENQELPIAASDVDCILLTHAHIDHSGLIPPDLAAFRFLHSASNI